MGKGMGMVMEMGMGLGMGMGMVTPERQGFGKILGFFLWLRVGTARAWMVWV